MKLSTLPLTRNALKAALFATCLILTASSDGFAQLSTEELRAKATSLMSQSKMTEAVPIIEKWIDADPEDVAAHENLGFALIGLAVHASEPAERKDFRIRARSAFMKSKALGNAKILITAMIESIPADGSDGEPFSDDPKSHALTLAGERAFTAGKIDEAIDYYKQAAAADAKNYFAALFVGDMLIKKDAFGEAETWYQKAIAIDPYRETAYRYSATPLMRQGKYDEARERYIDAWIVEPYSRFAVNGIVQWAEVTGKRLGHPKIDRPEVKVGADGKKSTNININPLADDGSMAWMAYVTTRESWEKGKFQKAYPQEKIYRHSLSEEADALREVVKMAKSLKPKNKNPQFEMIEKMDADGVLEAFVLMAIPTEGIAKDHAAYLRFSREKLRLYVRKYVISPGS